MRSSPAGTTRLTRPISAARSAEIMSPVSSISIACLRATLRESATIGVEQNRPISTPGVANLRCLRGDGEVAARDQLAAGGGGLACTRGDHRLRQGDDLLHHGAAGRHDLLEIGAAAVGVAAPPGELLEVVAGAERRPVGREHDRAHAGRAAIAVSASPSASSSRLGQAVARRRPVKRQHRDSGRRSRAAQRGAARGACGMGVHGASRLRPRSFDSAGPRAPIVSGCAQTGEQGQV